MALKIAALLLMCLVVGIFSAEENAKGPAVAAMAAAEPKEEMKTSGDLESANSYAYYGLGYAPYGLGYGYSYGFHPRFGYVAPYPYYSTYYTYHYGVPYTYHTFI